MEDLERRILAHLSHIDYAACRYYHGLMIEACDGLVHLSMRDYIAKYGGSYSTLKDSKLTLRKLGLICPMGTVTKLIPIQESAIGKLCIQFNTFAEQRTAINGLMIGATPLVANATPLVASATTLVASAEMETKPVSNEINNLQGNATTLVALDINTNTYSKLLKTNKTINNITSDERYNPCSATTLVAEKKDTMSYKEQVTQIWESWNEFAMKYTGATRRTKLPKPREVDSERNTTATSLYDSIAQWIIDQGDDWWDNWLDFIELAKGNSWLQSKEGFTVTLVNVFRGTTHDPTPVIIKAMEGLYDGWNLKINNDLDDSGKPTEAKIAQYDKGSKGMAVFGDVE